jgi:hypothetical protein
MYPITQAAQIKIIAIAIKVCLLLVICFSLSKSNGLKRHLKVISQVFYSIIWEKSPITP